MIIFKHHLFGHIQFALKLLPTIRFTELLNPHLDPFPGSLTKASKIFPVVINSLRTHEPLKSNFPRASEANE